MKKCTGTILSAILLSTVFLIPVASAGAVGFNTWYEFGYSVSGGGLKGCLPSDPAGYNCTAGPAGSVFADAPPWTFTAGSAGAVLKVTDAFDYQDIISVYDFGTLIGTTSFVSTAGACGNDPDVCFADPNSSSGSFVLAAGNHSITFTMSDVLNNEGAAFFKVTAVPEPSTWLMLLMALGSMGYLVRRRQP